MLVMYLRALQARPNLRGCASSRTVADEPGTKEVLPRIVIIEFADPS